MYSGSVISWGPSPNLHGWKRGPTYPRTRVHSSRAGPFHLVKPNPPLTTTPRPLPLSHHPTWTHMSRLRSVCPPIPLPFSRIPPFPPCRPPRGSVRTLPRRGVSQKGFWLGQTRDRTRRERRSNTSIEYFLWDGELTDGALTSLKNMRVRRGFSSASRSFPLPFLFFLFSLFLSFFLSFSLWFLHPPCLTFRYMYEKSFEEHQWGLRVDVRIWGGGLRRCCHRSRTPR